MDPAERHEPARLLAEQSGLLQAGRLRRPQGQHHSHRVRSIGQVPPGPDPLRADKAGPHALTRNMSTEVAPLGIRVNCVHPGLIETDMTDWVMKDPEILPQVLAQISLGRAGQPREVGTVVAFFASDEGAGRHRTVSLGRGGLRG